MGLPQWLYSDLFWWYSQARKSASPKFYSLVSTWFLLSLNLSTLVIGTIAIGFPEYEEWVNFELAFATMAAVALWVIAGSKRMHLPQTFDAEATSAFSSRKKTSLIVYFVASVLLACISLTL